LLFEINLNNTYLYNIVKKMKPQNKFELNNIKISLTTFNKKSYQNICTIQIFFLPLHREIKTLLT